MHEHSFINAIISPIKNKENVKQIELEVGELVGIEAEHLKEHLIERTNWDVNIKKINSLIKCDCGFNGRAKIKQRLHDIVIFCCPECEETPEVLEGKDIKILKVIYK